MTLDDWWYSQSDRDRYIYRRILWVAVALLIGFLLAYFFGGDRVTTVECFRYGEPVECSSDVIAGTNIPRTGMSSALATQGVFGDAVATAESLYLNTTDSVMELNNLTAFQSYSVMPQMIFVGIAAMIVIGVIVLLVQVVFDEDDDA